MKTVRRSFIGMLVPKFTRCTLHRTLPERWSFETHSDEVPSERGDLIGFGTRPGLGSRAVPPDPIVEEVPREDVPDLAEGTFTDDLDWLVYAVDRVEPTGEETWRIDLVQAQGPPWETFEPDAYVRTTDRAVQYELVQFGEPHGQRDGEELPVVEFVDPLLSWRIRRDRPASIEIDVLSVHEPSTDEGFALTNGIPGREGVTEVAYRIVGSTRIGLDSWRVRMDRIAG